MERWTEGQTDEKMDRRVDESVHDGLMLIELLDDEKQWMDGQTMSKHGWMNRQTDNKLRKPIFLICFVLENASPLLSRL